jgi:hypothetical protein
MKKLDKNCVITSKNCNKELEKYISIGFNNFGKYLITQFLSNLFMLFYPILSRRIGQFKIANFGRLIGSWIWMSRCMRLYSQLCPHPTYDFQSTFMGVQSNPNISLGQILSKNHSKTGF